MNLVSYPKLVSVSFFPEVLPRISTPPLPGGTWTSPIWAALAGPHQKLLVLHLLPNGPDFDDYQQLVLSPLWGKGGILGY